MEERIGHVPLGVIANISAWNYPYFVGGNVFVPALAAGNAVLYKPSEFATLTGQHIADLLHEAGVAAQRVRSPSSATARRVPRLLRQPVDGVFFTGSYRTGAAIAASTGRRMIKTQLELGGKDPSTSARMST
jgi:acyl-CoA reductase-like NAD-dependent aldehyde dehydrogenase